MKKHVKINPFEVMRAKEEKGKIEEYPLYPDSDDIYNKFKEIDDLDPEEPSKFKKPFTTEDEVDMDESGIDLDIPGSELDDDQEMIGSEDEENNYYSIGGDDHNDLDEDNV